jgi:hypothetical protein
MAPLAGERAEPVGGDETNVVPLEDEAAGCAEANEIPAPAVALTTMRADTPIANPIATNQWRRA